MTEPNNRVLVIGGSHGIGFEIVKLLLERGTTVTAVSRTKERLESEGLLSRHDLDYFPCDVVEDDLSCIELPDQLTGFVYCPGSINLGSLRTLKLDALRRDFELNVVAATKCFQAALPSLKASGRGTAVFFSTVAVNRGIAMHSYVAAAKGALQAMVKTWAAELAPDIRVNCIAPALTETPLAKQLLTTEAKRQALTEKYPLGRIGTPTDIAAMANFLLSDQSGWITGQTIGVDGGMSAIVPL